MKNYIIQYFASTIYILVICFVALYFNSNVVASAIKSSDVRNYLGTRTPYRLRFNKDDSKIKFPSKSVSNISVITKYKSKRLFRPHVVRDCKHSKIWMVMRHGTRLPSGKDVRGMNTKLRDLKYEILIQNSHGKGPLNKEQLQWFTRWSSNTSEGHEKFLTLEGQDEMILLAERMQKRFPNAIKHKYNNQTFKFRYTATQRTQQSAIYFTIGLFDKNNSREVFFDPVVKVDTTLRFYKHCDKWKEQVKKNPLTYKEHNKFVTSQIMNDTLKSVSKQLGLERVLPLDTVILMYKICGYETSWHKYYISPWCYGFDEKSVKTIEYYHDLKHYWLDGYGHNLTSRQACMLMKNMFESMSKESRTATFLFSHSGTMLKLLTHLQLYKPTNPLRGDAIDHDRTWRASTIDCFASNLAFVLYQCKDGDKILTLHQERIIKLPMCETELCPLTHLTKYFHNSIHNCNFIDMCKSV